MHTQSFSLTHKSCLTLSNKGMKRILCQFLSQPPCLLTNIVKNNLSNIMQLHLLCSYCVFSMCAYRAHWWQTAELSHPFFISPNVNSKEGWFTHHKLLNNRGRPALYCPKLFYCKNAGGMLPMVLFHRCLSLMLLCSARPLCRCHYWFFSYVFLFFLIYLLIN